MQKIPTASKEIWCKTNLDNTDEVTCSTVSLYLHDLLRKIFTVIDNSTLCGIFQQNENVQ